MASNAASAEQSKASTMSGKLTHAWAVLANTQTELERKKAELAGLLDKARQLDEANRLLSDLRVTVQGLHQALERLTAERNAAIRNRNTARRNAASRPNETYRNMPARAPVEAAPFSAPATNTTRKLSRAELAELKHYGRMGDGREQLAAQQKGLLNSSKRGALRRGGSRASGAAKSRRKGARFVKPKKELRPLE
jgi:hypothetical protein